MNWEYHNTQAAGSSLASTALKLFVFIFLSICFGSSSLHAQTVAFVANNDSNSVSVVDTATNTVIATVPLQVTGPIGVVASPDGARVYVTGAIGSGSGVDVIDTSANAVIATIPLPAINSVALPVITPDGNHLYVPDRNSGTVTVIDTANNVVAGNPIRVGSSCGALAITPDGTSIYVADPLDTAVVRIDTATNTAAPPISLGLGNPSDLAITPDGRHVYVSAPTPGQSSVDVIDTSTNTVTAQIPLPGSQELPFGLAITPDGSTVYVAEQVVFFAPTGEEPTGLSGLLVIDTATNTIISNIFFGFRPSDVAITPDGSLVYVTDMNTASVTVVSTATNTVVNSGISVGNSPQSIVIVNLSMPFAAFTIDNLNISPQGFHEQGDFTLGANSQGIDLAHQPVTLTIGSFSFTIPGGSFRQVGGNLHFVLNATINGLQVNFNLSGVNGSSTQFTYVVNVQGVDLTGQPDPVTVGLKIGNNTGTTKVEF